MAQMTDCNGPIISTCDASPLFGPSHTLGGQPSDVATYGIYDAQLTELGRADDQARKK